MADVQLVFDETIVELTSVSGASQSDIVAAVAVETAAREAADTAHALLDTGVHGVGASTVASAADVSGAVSTHNAIIASTSQAGHAYELATAAEAQAGTDTQRVLTPLSIQDLLYDLGYGFDWYVDSVNGNDNNAGTSKVGAFATIAKLLTQTIANNAKIGLARGSHWREQLTITPSSVTVRSYGEGAYPILDAADIVTGWSLTAGQTYTYEASVTSAAALGEQFINVWEDDLPLRRVASIAACEALDGSTYVTGASGAVTVYIHPSDDGNPTTNGKVYEVSVRNAGIYTVTDGHTIHGITTQKNQSASGSLVLGRSCIVQSCYCLMGNKHNLYVKDGSAVSNTHCIDQYYTSGATLFVYNENTPAGLGVTFTDCSASRPTTSALTENFSCTGFYGHKNTSGSFGTVTYTRCTASDIYYGFDGQDAALVLNACTVTDAVANSMLIQTGVVTSLTLTDCNFTATSSCFLTQGAGTCTVTISGGTYTDTASNQACIRVTVNNVTLNVSGATINTKYVCFGTDAGVTGLALTSNNNDLAVAYSYATAISTVAGSGNTYTGNNNTYRTGQGNVVNGTTYATLALLYAGTGQDQHSTFVP